MHAVTRATTGARPPIAREDRTFPWYIGGALGTAVLGGFALAIALPLAAALGWNWGVRWRALAQAHGHLQVIGWLGLFIAGMAFRLAPRFAGRPLRFPGVTPAVLILLALMLTRADPSGRPEKVDGPQAPFALLAGVGVAAVLLIAALGTDWVGNTEAPTNIAIEAISQRLFEDYGLPFILASVLLLVALIGAIIVARQEEGE